MMGTCVSRKSASPAEARSARPLARGRSTATRRSCCAPLRPDRTLLEGPGRAPARAGLKLPVKADALPWPLDGFEASLLAYDDSVHGLTVRHRFGAAGARARGADPDFYRLTAALRRVQATGAMGMRIERMKEQEWTLLTLPREDVPPEIVEEVRKFREILGIAPGAQERRVVYGSGRKSDDEIAMLTRSMMEVLTDIASTIEVPASHVEEGRTYQTPVFDTGGPGGNQPMMRSRSGPGKPDDAFFGSCKFAVFSFCVLATEKWTLVTIQPPDN